MPKDHESQRTQMEEKELKELENILSELVDEGELEVPVPEELVKAYQKEATADRAKRLWASIQTGDLLRQRLRAGRQDVVLSGLTFSQLIEKLRMHAKLSIGEIARSVHMQPEDLKAVEEGKSNPLQLPIDIMANMVETFALRLSVVEQSLKRSLMQRAMRAQMSALSARTTGKISLQEYERAIDDVAAFLAEQGEEDHQASLPEGYMSRLETTLKRRGRGDLV